MKPKTKIQKEVARLSANLRPISATQIDWAYCHCVEHIGYRTKKGNITCSDCGHEWHSRSELCDTPCRLHLPKMPYRTQSAGHPKAHLQGNAVFLRDNHLQRLSGNPCGAGQMREQERRNDALLLPRGCAALDRSQRQGY